MKSTLLVLLLLSAGCLHQPEKQNPFFATEAHQLNLKVQDSRRVFTFDERVVFVVSGKEYGGKDAFVQFFQNGNIVSITPVRTIPSTGFWFTVAPFTPGDYRAHLIVNGQPAAWVEFSVLQ